MLLKRRWLFILTNIGIIIMINIILRVLQTYFWVQIWNDYTWLLIFAAIFGFAWAIVNLFISKWMAKRIYKIKLIDASMSDPTLHRVYETVADIAQREWIKTPEVGYRNDPIPNAFATWPSKNSSLVAVSTGLLEKLDINEVRAVIGHEMTHIMNGDMVTMTLLQWILNTFVIFFARVIAQAISTASRDEWKWLSWLAYFGIVWILDIFLSLIASLILMWYSRQREYKADAGAAHYIDKHSMIAALQKLKSIDYTKEKQDAFATLKINNKSARAFLFSSHPTIEQRVKALQELV